jgi:hypothetical protein
MANRREDLGTRLREGGARERLYLSAQKGVLGSPLGAGNKRCSAALDWALPQDMEKSRLSGLPIRGGTRVG